MKKEELYYEPILAFDKWLKEKKDGRNGVLLLSDKDDNGFVSRVATDYIGFAHFLFCMMKENEELAMELSAACACVINNFFTKEEAERAKKYAKLVSKAYRIDDNPTKINLN